MTTTKIISAMAMAIIVFAACEKSDVDTLAMNQTKSSELTNSEVGHVFTTGVDDLTQADIDGLMLMREEEKLAHDVYVFFYKAYSVRTFDQISKSEEKHTSTVLSLINHFGLNDPATSESGVYASAEIQTLYNKLTAAGSTVEKALSTGAFIEEYDIADLQKLIAQTSNADLIMVYTNLKRGSENHLRAFTRTLSQYGETYVPQILSEKVYSEILAASSRNGKNGAGNGTCSNTGNAGKGNRGTNAHGGGNGAQVDRNGDGICDSTGIATFQNQGNSTKTKGKGNNGKGGNR